VFGEKTLEYVKELCDGNFDYFPRLSKTLQIYIISFVDLEDIGKLAQSCKHFREVNVLGVTEVNLKFGVYCFVRNFDDKLVVASPTLVKHKLRFPDFLYALVECVQKIRKS